MRTAGLPMRRCAAILLGALACADCTLATRLPAPAAPPGVSVRLGINGPTTDGTLIDHLCALQPMTLRVGGLRDISQVRQATDAVRRCPTMDLLLLVDHEDSEAALAFVEQLAAWLGSGVDVGRIRGIELGNERNYLDTAAQFGAFVADGARLLTGRFAGAIYAGGISSVEPDTIRWWQQARAAGAWPPAIGFAIHRYAQGDGTPASPQDGYVDRNAETRAILAAAEGRRIAVTETGYVFDRDASDEVIAGWYRDDL